jgi:hypothetical protein
MYKVIERFNENEGIAILKPIKLKKRKPPFHGGPDQREPKPTKPPRITIAVLATTVADLAKEMREGFKELKSDVQSIDARLAKVPLKYFYKST